ncbi:lipase 1 isoform X2 [Halyomorpha halys]|uniref:lipase 1 isoform X2 n=1 Tax=Halyomorpha halys TaxID=286706 RepID=UPI000D0C8490|nr:lipase 1-like isoform X2 [Halyomorpha halys]XP_024218634.1 lipase 1-like isoform X2 [Halyomorpha halys]
MWLFLVLSVLASVATLSAQDISVANLVLRHGYPFDRHELTTEDGYVLSLFRIPFGRTDVRKLGPPVILQHGLQCSAACWIVSEPDKGLGFILADQGYDVWMPNNRGTTYSKKHRMLNPDSWFDEDKYWDFSFHELGFYDLAASIDYILKATGHSTLYYIGHSEGTTQFFALMSSRPTYNQKVIHMSALAPVAFMENISGPERFSTMYGSGLERFSKLFHSYSVFSGTLTHLLFKLLCNLNLTSQELCNHVIYLTSGQDPKQLNSTLIPTITSFVPAGTSIKQLVHYSQLAHNGLFHFKRKVQAVRLWKTNQQSHLSPRQPSRIRSEQSQHACCSLSRQ